MQYPLTTNSGSLDCVLFCKVWHPLLKDAPILNKCPKLKGEKMEINNKVNPDKSNKKQQDDRSKTADNKGKRK